MKKRRLTKFGKFCVILITVCLLFTVFWFLRPVFSAQPAAAAEVTAEPTVEPTAVPTPTPTPVDTVFEKEYNENKTVNSEYIGKMKLESGLIEQNITQTTDNDKYLNRAWDNTVNNEGSVYLDYRNYLTDQNLIFYGHYVYYDASKMFTPLETLMDPANYEANKYIDVYFSPTDERRYVITDIFYYPLESTTLKYYHVNYDSTFFQTYYSAVKQADFYDTGETLTMNDRWISLQTCVRNHDELREIVLAKQIEK